MEYIICVYGNINESEYMLPKWNQRKSVQRVWVYLYKILENKHESLLTDSKSLPGDGGTEKAGWISKGHRDTFGCDGYCIKQGSTWKTKPVDDRWLIVIKDINILIINYTCICKYMYMYLIYIYKFLDRNWLAQLGGLARQVWNPQGSQ